MINDYKEQYLVCCKDLTNCFTKEDVKKHNAAMKRLAKLFRLLKNGTNKSFILELLLNENRKVRIVAAAHCLGLGIYIAKAEKTLMLIAKDGNDPFLVFEAKSTLDVWRHQGFLDF